MISILVFLVMLGVLVFVHELGHFMVAKWAGIYVERFSIGFGRRLFGRRIGETDYCVSALPLGGYVRMAGQSDVPQEVKDDGEVQMEEWEANVPEERRFTSKKPAVRTAVLFAGPFMNALFGMALYPIVLMMGQLVPVSTLDTRIGEPVQGAPAAEAGFKLGDRIVSVAGKPVHTWEDLVVATAMQGETEIDIEVERDGKTLHIQVTPREYEEDQPPGIGVPRFEPAWVGSVKKGWPAEKAGIEKGDLIERVDGQLVDWQKMTEIIRNGPGKTFKLTVKKADGTERVVAVTARAAGTLEPPEEGQPSPWRPNDKVVAVDGNPVTQDEAEDIVAERPGQTVTFTVKRRSLFGSREVTITETLGSRGMIGIVWEQATTMLKFPPGQAIVQGVVRSVKSVDLVLRTVRGLTNRSVKIKNLSGPVGIAVITARAWDAGFATLLQFMAILSFNFFVLNLLPLPVLDGGQLVLTGIEAVRRRPVDIRVQIWLQRVGIALLATLMVVVFYNDILKIIKGVF
ncbi:MAG: site-2 protease family protein [Candidatus Hydrogenedentes bacterium]|nr:site-2 protease family protein [Candidatus Hydrogenedentota bacterium]